jgi:hypothetical protein
MSDKKSIRAAVGLGLALLLYFGIGGLVLAQTDSAALLRVNQLKDLDVGDGEIETGEISLPEIPEVGVCRENEFWWLPLAGLAGGVIGIGYRVWRQKRRVSFGWVVGLGAAAYGLFAVLGCGCGEIGWCEATPVIIALVMAVGGGWLWVKQGQEAT